MSVFDDVRVDDDVDEPEIPAYDTPRTITASAMKLDLRGKSTRKEINRPTSRIWQEAAWDYYDAIGEVRFGFNLLGSVMSRVRLYPAVVEQKRGMPIDVTRWNEEIGRDSESVSMLAEKSVEAMEKLDHGYLSGGLSELQRAATINMSVAGEMYLVSPKRGQYVIASTDELMAGGDGRYRLKTSRESGDKGRQLDKTAYVARIWRSHPRWQKEADSSMLGVLDACEKLIMLDRVVRATARSRMHANMMFIPEGITVTTAEDSAAEEIEQQIYEGLTAPVTDEAAANTIVPVILRGPGDLGAQIRMIEVSRGYDPQLVAAADRALDRVLSGIDVPKDLVTGLSNVRYSNAIVLSDDLYRAHIEPLALLIADSLTSVYLRPYLRRAGVPENLVRKAVVWYDPSAVVARPDRSAAANEGYDRMAISGAAWRASRGFDDADAPKEEELLKRMAFEKTTLPPDTGVALVEHFAPKVFAEMRDQGQQKSGMPTEIEQLIDGGGGEDPAGQPNQHSEGGTETSPEAGTAPENRPEVTSPGGAAGVVPGEIASEGARPPRRVPVS